MRPRESSRRMWRNDAHAALVARQMGKVCVAGCEALNIDYDAREMRIGETVFNEGDSISLDGSTGEVIRGEIRTLPSEVLQVLLNGSAEAKKSGLYQQYAKLMAWADKTRTLGVRTNTDQPDQARSPKPSAPKASVLPH